MVQYNEIEFEKEFSEHRVAHGWLYSPNDDGYDHERALFPEDVLGWLAEYPARAAGEGRQASGDVARPQAQLLDRIVKVLDTPPINGDVTPTCGVARETNAPVSRMPRHNGFVLASWPVVSLDDWSVAGLEIQGQHPHDWLKHSSRKRTWLFKPARPERDRSRSEAVVEKLASELARLVGVPAAPVELAVRDNVHGALVEDVRLPNWELQAGQALMPEVVPDYDPDDPGRSGHNVRAIQQALTRFSVPPGSSMPEAFGAFDAFTGYLVFDALIAHGDRHDRNWAVLVPPPETTETESLCPTFDHAASLGFTLTDEACARHMQDRTVAVWASRGYARRFEHRPGTRWQTLVDLANSAATLCGPTTRDYWRERIMAVDSDSVVNLVAAAPGMSEIARRFTVELIRINRGRLLDVLR